MLCLLRTALLLAAIIVVINRDSLAADQPNFLVIVVDDYGWTDGGCFGSDFYETPAIDALAERSLRFTQGYATCPVCSPTRVSLQTGRNPARLATTDWFGALQPSEARGHKTYRNRSLLPAAYHEELPVEEKTVAEYLGEAGYRTFFAGKWHLGGEGFLPTAQGYDVNQGGNHTGTPRGGYFSPYRNPQLEDGPKGEHLPMRLARETADFIRQQENSPFFAMLSFYSVHNPQQGREHLIKKYQRKLAKSNHESVDPFGDQLGHKTRLVQDHPVYAAMVEGMDMAVGHVLEALREANIEDNTVVVFTSDNGGLSTAEGSPTANLPLRAGKGWLYEGGIRVPWIVHWPGVTAEAAVCETPITSSDLLPTLLEIANVPVSDGQILDGQSIAPLLRGEKRASEGLPGSGLSSRSLYWHYPHYGNQGGRPGSAILKGEWKLIRWYESETLELYHLQNDLSETTNLAEQEPERAEQMTAELDEWLRSIDARYPSDNPNWAAAE